jgi:hypothetical protein
VKKIILITVIGMLALGASFISIKAQNQPTGAPDTSVSARPAKIAPATTTTVPANANRPKQEAVKEPVITETTVIIGIITTALIIVLVVVVLIRRNRSKK